MKSPLWIVGIVCAALLALPAIAAAQTPAVVTAHFDGTSSTDVDGYPGAAGGGWTAAWNKSTTTSSLLTRTWMSFAVDGYAPFDTANPNNYLRIQMQNTSDPLDTLKGKGSVYRRYTDTATGGIDRTKPYSIAFSVRPEDMLGFTTSKDIYRIWGEGDMTKPYNPSAKFTFAIQGSGGAAESNNHWIFRSLLPDETGVQSSYSNVYLVEDHIYNFLVTMHPAGSSFGTWDVTVTDTMFDAAAVALQYPMLDVSNAVASAAFNSLRWGSVDSTDGGYLLFGLQDGSNTLELQQTMSIDNIVITQLESPPVTVPGDTNNDGKVDEADAGKVAENWGRIDVSGVTEGDFNGDNAVNAADASILAANWHYGVSESAASAVPEPSMAALLGLAVLAMVARRRAR